ncbi:MAG TPA: hypothetical protein VKR61_01940 [Bryobacteraceae bacterium]|nr:hypothetical protein [Bryobacteraceae bacterium]
MRGRFLSGALVFSSLIVILFPASAADSSVQTAPTVDSPGCAAQVESFLNGKLAFWQPRLKLADWKISIVMSSASDLKPKTLGNIHWDAPKKSAVIRVLRASEYQLSCRGMLDDMEMTVVHELVHLELSSLPRSQASRREEEHAVNRIADALLALERANDAAAVQASR